MAKVCPLCGVEVGNEFEHYRLDHNIKDASQFEAELAKVKAKKAKQDAYAKFVDELNEKQTKGLITGEEWRRLSEQWRREHGET